MALRPNTMSLFVFLGITNQGQLKPANIGILILYLGRYLFRLLPILTKYLTI